jgi:hypothetical protein
MTRKPAAAFVPNPPMRWVNDERGLDFVPVER